MQYKKGLIVIALTGLTGSGFAQSGEFTSTPSNKEEGLLSQMTTKLLQSATNDEKKSETISQIMAESVKISGFIGSRYIATDDNDKYGGFDIRFLRFVLSGNITNDFGYRVQMEFAGSPRILDTWLEWKKFSFLKVRAGQQKRNFGYENMVSPMYLGVTDYSQVVMALNGFTDRVGEQASGGRDIGILLNGDFVKYKGNYLFSYGAGVFNGNGINKADNNNTRDYIGSFNVMPIPGLKIGTAYWYGHYGEKPGTVDRYRWFGGLQYDKNDYTVRAEYISSRGGIYGNPDAAKRSDGWFVFGGVPFKKILKFCAQYDAYRENKHFNSLSNKYMGAINWYINKYIILQGNYVYETSKITHNHANSFVAQLFVKY